MSYAREVDSDLVKEEYFHLQKTVEDFDQRGLTIKAWSVTLSMGGIAAAFTQKQPGLLLLASLSAILFWLIEAIWKRFQLAYYYRIKNIEAYLSGESPDGFSAPRITRDWSTGFRQYSLQRVIWWPQIFLPHLVVALFGVVSWVVDLSVKFMPREL